MIDADIVIDVFDSCVRCLSSLLDTEVGGWIGGCIIVCFIIGFFREMSKI